MNQIQHNKKLMEAVIGALLSDRGISQPLYCPNIVCEQDGERMSDSLPLIYIWNENLKHGSCSISINGPIVGEALEAYLPRSDPEFATLLTEIMETIREASLAAIRTACEKTGTMPSVAFSKEVYLDVCRRK